MDSDDVRSLTSSDGNGQITPTHTGTSSPSFERPPSYSSLSCPFKGGRFVILERESGRVITLRKGKLVLCLEGNEHDIDSYRYGPSHWDCVENEHLWFGFENVASGKFIGHNDKKQHEWRFIAEASAHEEWEWFCTRAHPNGGHILLVKHNNGFLPMKAGGAGNRELVVDDKEKKGTRWDFIRIGSGI